MALPESELAYTLPDYVTAGVEPPARIVDNPELTEGEMMSIEEIEEFIKDSIATLRILADGGSARFEQLKDQYVADLTYLAQVGSIDETEFSELINENNFKF